MLCSSERHRCRNHSSGGCTGLKPVHRQQHALQSHCRCIIMHLKACLLLALLCGSRLPQALAAHAASPGPAVSHKHPSSSKAPAKAPDAVLAAAKQLNVTAPVPGPAKQQTPANVSALPSDATAAQAWYRELAPTDAQGRTNLAYGIQRFYGSDILDQLPALLDLLFQGLDSVLQAVQLAFTPHYLVPVRSADPANVYPRNLTRFTAVDLYFALALQQDAVQRAPLNADLLDLMTNFLTARLQQAGFGAVGSIFLDLSFPAGFANVQSVFVKETFFSCVKVSGDGLLPFSPEKETLVLAALSNVFQNNSLSARTEAIVPSVSFNPAESGDVPPTAASSAAPTRTPARASRRRRGRLLLQTGSSSGSSSAGVQQLDIIIRTRMYPVKLVTASQLWQRALAGSHFERETAALGLPLHMEFQNATIDTTDVPLQGSTAMSITYDPARDSSGNLVVPPAMGTEISPEPASEADDSLSTGAIVGIALACTAVVSVILAAAVLAVVCRLRARCSVTRGCGVSEDDTESTSPGVCKHGCKAPSTSSISRSSSCGGTNIWAPSSSVPVGVHSPTRSPNGTSRNSGRSGSSEAASTAPDSGFSGLVVQRSTSISGYSGQEIDAAEVAIFLREDGTPWLLGRGSFGQVYKALRRGVQEVAIKKLDGAGADAMWLRMLHKEIATLSKVSFDRNIVQYYGACLDPNNPMLVMEYCAGGDLRQAFMTDDADEFAWDKRGRGIALDIARGLHFLHSSGVVHRDLKTSNVLLSAEGVAKIGDVGLAKMMSTADQQSLDTTAGTFAYAAPELILGLRCTDKADVYSFGVVLWEIVTKELPRRGQLRDVEVPRECPADIAQLIDDCLQPSPDARPSAQQLFRRILKTTPGPDAAMYSPFQQPRFSSVTC